VHTSAMRKALARSASTMGISIISGGIGNTELSMKETAASAGVAWRCPARPMVQSYRRLNMGAV